METILKIVVNFFSDKKRKFLLKFLVALLILSCIYIANDIIGFTDYLIKGRKIEQIKTLTEIITNPAVDSITKAYAIKERNEILNKKTVFDQTLSFFRNKSQVSKKPTNSTIKANEPSIRNNFNFFLSSSGLFALSGVAIFLIITFLPDSNLKVVERIVIGIILLVMALSLGLFFYWLFSFIPQITKSTWGWNYTLNVVLQILTMMTITHYTKKSKRIQRYA